MRECEIHGEVSTVINQGYCPICGSYLMPIGYWSGDLENDEEEEWE